MGLPWWLRSKEFTFSAGMGIQSLGQEDPLEEGKAKDSSILAWSIPWTGKPGGLQSVGSQRVGHDKRFSMRVHTYQSALG